MVDNSYVRNISVRLVIDYLKKADVDVEAVLSRAGLLMRDVCKEDGWLAFNTYAHFFEIAAEVLNDPYFALKLSRDTDPREFGALAYMGISSTTLEDSLLNLKHYMRVVTGAWNMDVLTQDKSVILEIIPNHPDFFNHQLVTEWFVANLIHGYQFFIARPYAPREVHFVPPLAENKKLDHYEQLLGCKVLFGQDNCQIIIDRKAMKLPVKYSDDRLLKVLKLHCDQFLQEHDNSRSVITAKIRKSMVDLLPSGRAKAKLIASELGMSERTMLRYLANENTSFSEIRETLRCDLAIKYIQDKRLSLKQIAYLLGYGDQSAFSVAFKRWKGLTPREARKSEIGR